MGVQRFASNKGSAGRNKTERMRRRDGRSDGRFRRRFGRTALLSLDQRDDQFGDSLAHFADREFLIGAKRGRLHGTLGEEQLIEIPGGSGKFRHGRSSVVTSTQAMNSL